ncbi:beta-TrCP-like [Littorina saxatilis]|uniref:beta-TrCP-like n=1 Tax=Littorina saxatilis TaxID=31220 RepID=UPI0038B5823E
MNAVEFLASHNAASHKAALPPHITTTLHDTASGPKAGGTCPPGHGGVGPLSSARHTPVLWRGHGGRQPTSSSVEFDRQLDKVSIWMEQWEHDTRCALLEALLRRSNYTQFQFLFTVMQPSLHRDFMYTAHSRFPDIEFKPISTHISRELKDKLSRLRLDTFHRVKSAYLQDDGGGSSVKLPIIDTPSARTARFLRRSPRKSRTKSLASRPWLTKSLTMTSSFQSVGSEGMMTDRMYPDSSRMYPDSSRTSQSDPATSNPVSRFIEMPVRRHIQEEKSPRQMQSYSRATGRFAPTPELVRKRTKNPAAMYEHDLPAEAKQIVQWYCDKWNDTKKNEFYHKMLLKLDPRQHYFISSFLSLKQHKDFITQLPEDVSLKILSFLSPKELVDVSRVSKAWQKLASHNSLWEAKCREVKLEVPVSDNPIWKRVFRDNLYLRLNWNSGACRVTDFKGHTLSVLTVTFDKERVASGSADKTIRVWDIKTGQTLHVLKGHTKGIWCLEFFTQHLLVSGAFDATIRIWNLRTGTTSRTLLGHAGPVWCMARRGTTLVSGSQDKTAKVWDISRCLLLHTLIGHNAAIFAVDMSETGSIIVTGSADRTVRLWTAETGKCKKTIWVSQTTSVMSVSYSHGYFACAYGNTICLYNGTKLVRTFNEHRKRVETVELRMANVESGEGMIVSGGKDALVKYWDIKKPDSIQTFEGHSQNVNCIHFDVLRIASASYDNKIRLWDFNI